MQCLLAPSNVHNYTCQWQILIIFDVLLHVVTWSIVEMFLCELLSCVCVFSLPIRCEDDFVLYGSIACITLSLLTIAGGRHTKTQMKLTQH